VKLQQKIYQENYHQENCPKKFIKEKYNKHNVENKKYQK